MKLPRVAMPTLVLAAVATAAAAANDVSWPAYGGNAAGQRFSALTQINRSNVAQLTEVWRFNAGPGGLQTSPLVSGGRLFAYLANQQVVALDPATGSELWRFIPAEPGFQPARGFGFWQSGSEQRLFASSGNYVIALDPVSGRPIPGFGDQGRIDLRAAMSRDPATFGALATSPPVIFGDLLIAGYRTSEAPPAAPGRIRAWDVRTGALRWSFDTIPQAGEPGSETWPDGAAATAGGANAWAGLALDERRGIVFVPTGSAVSDFYGADRHGDNLFANSLIALDARTGKHLWHRQLVHHDVLDRDLPSPPALLTVRRGGQRIDAVAQATKQGLLFVFERATGRPLFDIEERAVPQSDVPGEQTSPTQPFPVLPEPFARQSLTQSDLSTHTPAVNAELRARFAVLHSEGPFAPLRLRQKSVVFPGYDGGAEWGGAAVDPARGVIYLNANDVPWLGGLAEVRADANASPGQMLYETNCAACHGALNAPAGGAVPALGAARVRLSREQIETTIARGRGRMPGLPQLHTFERGAIAGYVLGDERRPQLPPEVLGMVRELMPGTDPNPPRYRFTGYEKFRDSDGYPAVTPPWGTLNAIDLNSGRILWRVPLGEYPALMAQGFAPTGSENYGGPLLTRSGVLFIGATIYDRKFRAFDAANGHLLWQAALPYAGTASPVTYTAGGRQFVVIATSGARDPNGPQGSAYVAFALPPRGR